MQGLQLRVILAVALAFTATAVQAQIQEPFMADKMLPQATPFAEHVEYRDARVSRDAPVMAPKVIHEPDARFIKVHFSAFNVPAGVRVEVRNPQGTEVHRYSRHIKDGITIDRKRGDDGVQRFSALSITGDTAIVRIVGQTRRFDSRYHRVEIDTFLKGEPIEAMNSPVHSIERALGSGKSKTETTCGINERYDAVCWQDTYPDQYDRARPVAMLVSPEGHECTAWRVGDDNHLFTAEHCLSTQEALDGSEIWFNYQASTCGGEAGGKAVKVTGGQLLATDAVFDYTLFTVDDFDKVASFGNLGLDVRDGSRGENIFIPQHGRGDPLQIAIESDRNDSGLCEIDDESRDVYADDSDIGYYCDTTSSSSGSPVVSGVTGKVIALHHMGGCYNMGVKVSKIWPQVSEHFGGEVPEGDSDADWAPSNELPEASYFADCDKLSCAFDAIDSYDADGSIASYHWNFGDGSEASGRTVEHDFSSEGDFAVSLTVEDNEGASDTFVTEVSVTEPNADPNARFSTACVDNDCSLNAGASEDSDGSIEQWSWSFGDGETAEGERVSHEYAEAGRYTITLTVADNEGAEDRSSRSVEVRMPNLAPTADFSFNCENQSCRFDASGSQDSDGEITEYQWAFGDGGKTKGAVIDHSYYKGGKYDVSLTVTDDRGESATVTQSVEVESVNQEPHARIWSSCEDLDCQFGPSNSYDPDGSIDSYQWTFGDGKSSSDASPVHQFAKAGRYTVRLTVTDNEGAKDTQSVSVTVEAPSAITITLMSDSSTSSRAYLKYSGIKSSNVIIKRNGKPLANSANSGRFVDVLKEYYRKEARYQVCEAKSDSCSKEILVAFKS
jgi:PKD repeat protein